jgi:hypothetical protein
MRCGLIICVLLLISSSGGIAQMHPARERSVPETYAIEENPDIQWFREEMRIAPQYIEAQRGVLGMTWPHFIIMLFLILFFIGALFAYYRLTTQTTRILQQPLSREE